MSPEYPGDARPLRYNKFVFIQECYNEREKKTTKKVLRKVRPNSEDKC
jgi:hypothetical protein